MSTQLKGYQVRPEAPFDDVSEAVSNGAKLIRYQILSQSNDFETWRDESIAQTWNFLQNIYPMFPSTTFIIDLHTVPSLDPAQMTAMIREYWNAVLDMLPPRPRRLILDIINEPALEVRQNADLMRTMVAFIRGRNRSIPISVTSAYGDPTHFTRVPFFEGDDNIYYQFHFYLPMQFTHQGVYQYPAGKTYPTTRNNAERMRRNLDRVYTFREKHPTAKILCGEFSCVDFTDPVSRARWTRDAIIHLRRLKAHWCWHAWREWQHWQPEGETLRVLAANMENGK